MSSPLVLTIHMKGNERIHTDKIQEENVFKLPSYSQLISSISNVVPHAIHVTFISKAIYLDWLLCCLILSDTNNKVFYQCKEIEVLLEQLVPSLSIISLSTLVVDITVKPSVAALTLPDDEVASTVIKYV